MHVNRALGRDRITYRKEQVLVMATSPSRFRGEVRAPDFPEGLDWINSDHQIHISEFRGRILIIHFWTLC